MTEQEKAEMQRLKEEAAKATEYSERLKTLEAQMAERDRKEAQDSAAEYVEKLVSTGRVAPAAKAGLVSVLAGLAGQKEFVVEFSETEKQKPALDALKAVLDAIPEGAIVPGGKLPGNAGSPGAVAGASEYAEVGTVDEDRLDILNRARALVSEKIDLPTAIAKVMAEVK